MLYFPAFLAQSIGMSVNNAKAALEAWLGIKSGFIRTPKYDLTRRGQRWHQLKYRSAFSATVYLELAMALYTTAGLGYAIVSHEYGATPFLVLFAAGYWLVAGYSIHHGLVRMSWIARPSVHHVEEIEEAMSPEPMGASAMSAMSAMSER
jgi:hypothetical protein